MTVREVYSELGGNYDEIMSRIPDDAFVEKYLKKFAGVDYAAQVDAVATSDSAEEIFKMAHGIKGMGLNLSLTKTVDISEEICTLLRGKTSMTAEEASKAKGLSARLAEECRRTVSVINQAFLAN
ncbi:MAG: hypothetical protein K5641_02795 [Lachnospiraceae bacterium]|nr:hypothetical protein [Lachnospiraceae bacterium]